ncbi:tRNA lysidine(34) synthetase TilS [Puerhibacterium puerhi]|uniref:tRNA lysidine(34) synthetase TilS n=1 Tax=Puerhibacterium puerhi TaxID=2692623 RepID=UPI00135B70BE|nr:tRNA lysidine(34) synthetase TilS [Puerhibacterium puerhi]
MGRVDRALAAVRAAVRAELAGLGPEDLVLVACSGGPDSLALAAALAHEAPRAGRSVRSPAHGVRAGAVVVDHGLQPGSDAVAARAAAQCRALGLDPVVVRRVEVPCGPGGPEARAREARYAALDAVAAERGAAAVLLGHTLDDQAESVLLGLARGSGARSLAGMPRRRGVYRRPLLDVRRAQTLAACAALGLEPWHDPTNVPATAGAAADGAGAAADGAAAAAPARSRVRHEALPVLEAVLGPGIAPALARTAALLRDDADALDALAADLLARATTPELSERAHGMAGGGSDSSLGGAPAPDVSVRAHGMAGARTDNPEGVGEGDVRPGGLVLDAGVLAAAPAALRRRALRAAAAAVVGSTGALTARHVDALDALVVDWHGQGEAGLPTGAAAGRACGRVFLRPARSPEAESRDAGHRAAAGLHPRSLSSTRPSTQPSTAPTTEE